MRRSRRRLARERGVPQYREDPLVHLNVPLLGYEDLCGVVLDEHDRRIGNTEDGEPVLIGSPGLPVEWDDRQAHVRERRDSSAPAELLLHQPGRSRTPPQRTLGEYVVPAAIRVTKDSLPVHARPHCSVDVPTTGDVGELQDPAGISLGLQQARNYAGLEVEDFGRFLFQATHFPLTGGQATSVRGSPGPCLRPCRVRERGQVLTGRPSCAGRVPQASTSAAVGCVRPFSIRVTFD